LYLPAVNYVVIAHMDMLFSTLLLCSNLGVFSPTLLPLHVIIVLVGGQTAGQNIYQIPIISINAAANQRHLRLLQANKQVGLKSVP
jgi:hypothetical protein